MENNRESNAEFNCYNKSHIQSHGTTEQETIYDPMELLQ